MGGHRLVSCKHSPKGESVMQPNPYRAELGCRSVDGTLEVGPHES